MDRKYLYLNYKTLRNSCSSIVLVNKQWPKQICAGFSFVFSDIFLYKQNLHFYKAKLHF